MLKSLPDKFDKLTALQSLSLRDCSRLKLLPESLGELVKLQANKLRSAPKSTASSGGMWCFAQPSTSQPDAEIKLQHLKLGGCKALEERLELTLDSDFLKLPPRQQIQQVLQKQQQQAAINQLVGQQDTMLTTLERMSWLAVLLATATFVAYMSPPGGTENGQVLASNSAVCTDWKGDSEAFHRSCALLAFFVLDGLSFAFSLGCVIMIIVLSMPRIKYKREHVEAGRFWILLLITWVLLYMGVLTGFGAFIASDLAVHNRRSVILVPVLPGMLLLGVGIVAIMQRFYALYPGRKAVGAAHIDQSLRKRNYEKVDPDIEQGQAMFWKHCNQVLAPSQGKQQVAGWPVSVLGSSQELVRLLSEQQRQNSSRDLGHSSSHSSSTSHDKAAAV
jgi:hypothetical protein